MRATHRLRPGFSLTELLLVVAMIGILAALAVPSFSPDVASQLQSAGAAMTGDLAYARSLAVANNSSYRISVDVASNRYTLTHSGTNPALNNLPSGPMGTPSDPATRRTTDLDQLPTMGARVSLLAVQRGSQTFTSADVDFTSVGGTSSAQPTVIWLTAGAGGAQRFLAVRVNPVTGLATADEVTATPPATGAGAGS